MKEQLISFETAKLAKEKGFNIEVEEFYLLNKSLYTDGDIMEKFNHNSLDDVVSAPTQSLLQKWLREKHNLHIWVESDTFMKETWGYMFSTNFTAKQTSEELTTDETIIFNSYEEALEKALYHMLKLI